MDLNSNLHGPQLPPVPGGWTVHEIGIGGNSFQLWGPATPDVFLDIADSADAPAECPYWADLWPAAREMAEFVLAREWPSPGPTLELGCGIGLVGIAALAAGLDVTLTDAVPLAVRVAKRNAKQNGYQPAARTLDWNNPPGLTFPRILAADVLYDRELHPALLNTVDQILGVDGECWLGDPGRTVANEFVTLAEARGFSVSLHPPPLTRGEFCVLQLVRANGSGPAESS